MSEINNQELIDINEDFEYDLLESSAGKKKYLIRGCFSKAGVKNINGRVYPNKVMREAVEKIKDAVAKGRFIAECEHPTSAKINIENIAALVTKIDMNEEGAVLGEMRILDTPKGKIIKTLIDEGVKLGVSTRGTGKVKKKKIINENGISEEINEVQSGFKLRAIDIVFDPSAGDYGSPEFIAEGIEFSDYSTIKESPCSTIKDVFNTLLS